VRRIARTRKPTNHPLPTNTTRIPGEVMRVALSLAEGDPARLQMHRDGSVTVLNGRR
jgi:hypothetical protein